MKYSRLKFFKNLISSDLLHHEIDLVLGLDLHHIVHLVEANSLLIVHPLVVRRVSVPLLVVVVVDLPVLDRQPHLQLLNSLVLTEHISCQLS